MSIKGYLFIFGLVCLSATYAQALEAPVVYTLTADDYTVSITGENFGYVKHVVDVQVDGLSHRILTISDTDIVCRKNPSHGDYVGPFSVFVDVDGQSTTAIIPEKETEALEDDEEKEAAALEAEGEDEEALEDEYQEEAALEAEEEDEEPLGADEEDKEALEAHEEDEELLHAENEDEETLEEGDEENIEGEGEEDKEVLEADKEDEEALDADDKNEEEEGAHVVALQPPVVYTLTADDYIVSITGENFGYIKHVVNVKVDELSHRILALNSSIIICKRNPSHGAYVGPFSVYVDVDGQSTTATIGEEEALEAADAHAPVDKESTATGPRSDSLLSNSAVLYVGIPAFVVLVALALFLVVRKRKLSAAAKTDTGDAKQPKSEVCVISPNHSIMVRDSSMEEIDLNKEDKTHELHRSESASSISCSSTYSSTNNTPGSISPDVPSSPSVSRHHNEAREKMMSTRIGLEAASRLRKQSLDSPYLHRQSGFDSPLASSQGGMTPGRTPLGNSGHLQKGFDSPICSTPTSTPLNNNPLASSQEISDSHASPFDSDCALHSAIQRAAIIRQTSSNQPAAQQPQIPPHLLQGRRASVGGVSLKHGSGRRGSLSTLLTSALHNSTELARQQQKQSLRASQPINKVDEMV